MPQFIAGKDEPEPIEVNLPIAPTTPTPKLENVKVGEYRTSEDEPFVEHKPQ